MAQTHEYGLQSIADANRTIVRESGMVWAETIHTQMTGGHLSPDKGNRELKLRAMFKAIRALEVGDERQKRKARELSRFLELTWSLSKAYVTAGEGDIDVTRVLREAWGEAQLPPAYPRTVRDPFELRDAATGEFVNGLPADEAVIESVVRRLK